MSNDLEVERTEMIFTQLLKNIIRGEIIVRAKHSAGKYEIEWLTYKWLSEARKGF